MDSDQAWDRVSRRRMLKRIGAGAAIAWTAPVLTSINTPSLANAVSQICFPQPCVGIGCSECAPVSNGSPGCISGSCTGGLGCVFLLDSNGSCQNAQNAFCSCLAPCNDNCDCASHFCAKCTGCGPGGVCVGCCGSNCHGAKGAPRRRGGPTLVPRSGVA